METQNEKKGLTKLKKYLLENDIKQSELAEKTGLKIPQISGLASGRRKDCFLSTARKIANALGQTVDALF